MLAVGDFAGVFLFFGLFNGSAFVAASGSGAFWGWALFWSGFGSAAFESEAPC